VTHTELVGLVEQSPQARPFLGHRCTVSAQV